MTRIIFTIIILGTTYYLLSQPTPLIQTTKQKSLTHSSTQTDYPSPNEQEALIEEIITQIKQLNNEI